MSLADLVAVKEVVETTGGTFEVQGLTLKALAGLLKDHSEELASLFDGELDFAVLLKECPELVSKCIAYAAGESEQIEKVRCLPFGVQLVAMKKVWDLTAVDTDELGKMVRQLMDGLESLSEKPEIQKLSKTG